MATVPIVFKYSFASLSCIFHFPDPTLRELGVVSPADHRNSATICFQYGAANSPEVPFWRTANNPVAHHKCSQTRLLRTFGNVRQAPVSRSFAPQSPLRICTDSEALEAGFLFDTDDHRVRTEQMLHAGFPESGLLHPSNAFSAGIIEATGRFDQHIQAHQQAKRIL